MSANDFEYKSFITKQKMTLAEITEYYLSLRKYEHQKGIALTDPKYRDKIHFILYSLIKLSRILSGEKIVIVNDKHHKTYNPTIFASTHVGGDDVQIAFEAIKERAHLFLGDPNDIYQRIEGLLLHLNGVICLETRDKEDRQIAYKRAIELLKMKKNLLIFPEGAWNVSANLPVMKLFNGTTRMALETGAEIVPMALEQYDKTFYVNIGENLSFPQSSVITVNDYTSILRDALATLKWEIWEKYGQCHREDIPAHYEDSFVTSIMNRSDYAYDVNDIYETLYVDKKITRPEDVWKGISEIDTVTKDNADAVAYAHRLVKERTSGIYKYKF